MNLGLARASLISLLGLVGMSLLTVDAEVITLNTSNGLYNTGVEIDDLTLIQGDSSGISNPSEPANTWTATYYADPAIGSAPPPIYTSGYYGTPTNSIGPAYVASPTAVDPYNSADDWVTNFAHAQWITYSDDMKYTVWSTPDTAVTVYQLVLSSIPMGDPVTLQGEVAADDSVTIYANGRQLYSDYSVSDNGSDNNSNYDRLNSLSALTFFSNGGNNDLDFVVVNNGGYATGLDAQLTGSYTTTTAAAAPEPSTYALLAVSLLALLIWAHARRAPRSPSCTSLSQPVNL